MTDNSDQAIRTASNALDILDANAVSDITTFIESKANDDGGYKGRAQQSDLYYTFFAISTLLALQANIPQKSLQNYLESFKNTETLDFVHLSCLIRSRTMLNLKQDPSTLKQLDLYKSNDGGFNQLQQHADASTIYAIYIALLTINPSQPHKLNPLSLIYKQKKKKLISCIKQLRTEDGAFANEANMTQGTTTATAAAIILLSELGDGIDKKAVNWLTDRHAKAGGFFGTSTAPIPDLLSTAAALQALKQTGHPMNELTNNSSFIDLLWDENGGFCGSPADLIPDVEYTFYSLLALGSLS